MALNDPLGMDCFELRPWLVKRYFNNYFAKIGLPGEFTHQPCLDWSWVLSSSEKVAAVCWH